MLLHRLLCLSVKLWMNCYQIPGRGRPWARNNRFDYAGDLDSIPEISLPPVTYVLLPVNKSENGYRQLTCNVCLKPTSIYIEATDDR